MPAVAIGTRVFVEEDESVYISVGNTTAEIAARLGWTQENVWMPEHALKWNRTWHPVILDPPGTAALVLRHADSVHEDQKYPQNAWYFLVDGDVLRTAGKPLGALR